MEKNEISEEVTVTPIIRDIERLFNRMANGFWVIIKLVFGGIRDIFIMPLYSIIILVIMTLIGGVLGFYSTEIFPRKYASSMVLKINVDAKDQLTNDIGYVNALIEKGANEKLSELFAISENEASTLMGCEINTHSDFIERTGALNDLYNRTDTAISKALDIDALLADENSDLSSKYRITFYASDQIIFSKLEKPFLTYLERVEELQGLLLKSQEALEYKRNIYLKEMQGLDTLLKVLNSVLISQAENTTQGGADTYISFGNDGQEKKSLSALDVQDKYIFYAQKIPKLDVQILEHQTCYFVSSHLNDFGSKTGSGRLKRTIILASTFFVGMLSLLFIIRLRKKTA